MRLGKGLWMVLIDKELSEGYHQCVLLLLPMIEKEEGVGVASAQSPMFEKEEGVGVAGVHSPSGSLCAAPTADV